MQDTLRITEVFYSLQGETRTAGLPTVFVRLTGCPLRCQYCDSAYAFSGGTIRTLDDILEQVAGFRPRYVCVTGGEPLAQPNAIPLLKQLCDAGYEVSLETSGALDISAVDPRFTVAGIVEESLRHLTGVDSYTYATLYSEAQRSDNPGIKDDQLTFSPFVTEMFRTKADPIMFPDVDWSKYIYTPMNVRDRKSVV